MNRSVPLDDRAIGDVFSKDLVLKNQLLKWPTRKFMYEEFFNEQGLQPEMIDILLGQINHSKNPGSPLVHRYVNNGVVFREAMPEFVLTLNQRLVKWEILGAEMYKVFENEGCKAFVDLFRPDPLNRNRFCDFMLSNGFADPVLLSVKKEPRKVEKIPRLVCMVSLCDNAAARVVIGDLLLWEQTLTGISTAVCLDITTQAETKKLYEEFRAQAPLMSSDVQGWEYSCRYDTLMADMLRMAYMMRLTTLDFEVVGSRRHLYALIGMVCSEAFRTMQTSYGNMFTTPVGVVSSGGLPTFSRNSFRRAYLSEKVASMLGRELRYQKCAGDDNLDTNPEAENLYRQLGYVVTDYTMQEEEFDFCSTKFTKYGSYNMNIHRFAVNFMFDAEKWDERMEAFEIFRNHPEAEKYRRILIENQPRPAC